MMMNDARVLDRRREGTVAVEALLLAVMVSAVLWLLGVGATLDGQESTPRARTRASSAGASSGG